jgi:hypothetical protein
MNEDVPNLEESWSSPQPMLGINCTLVHDGLLSLPALQALTPLMSVVSVSHRDESFGSQSQLLQRTAPRLRSPSSGQHLVHKLNVQTV